MKTHFPPAAQDSVWLHCSAPGSRSRKSCFKFLILLSWRTGTLLAVLCPGNSSFLNKHLIDTNCPSSVHPLLKPTHQTEFASPRSVRTRGGGSCTPETHGKLDGKSGYAVCDMRFRDCSRSAQPQDGGLLDVPLSVADPSVSVLRISAPSAAMSGYLPNHGRVPILFETTTTTLGLLSTSITRTQNRTLDSTKGWLQKRGKEQAEPRSSFLQSRRSLSLRLVR